MFGGASPAISNSPLGLDSGSLCTLPSPYDTNGRPINYGVAAGQETIPAAPPGSTWIAPPPDTTPQVITPVPYNADPGWGQPVVGPCDPEAWHWQILPRSVIYHSYWAGVHEPRLAIVPESETNGGASFWDGTLGGRAGLLRYGTGDGPFPQGWELDVEAAAMVRLTLNEIRDFETADYRVGVPLTYGKDNFQYKFAIYHLSSHLGDEFAIAHPGSLASRINYVRDELVYGASYYPTPEVRSYFEIGWAFNADGGAEPWEIQFGDECSKPGPTGPWGTPFSAYNVHLRQEVDWGGDFTLQVGWLWRNETAQVARMGLHYFNGKSSQFQTFNQFEQQIGFGLWYDF